MARYQQLLTGIKVGTSRILNETLRTMSAVKVKAREAEGIAIHRLTADKARCHRIEAVHTTCLKKFRFSQSR